MKKVSLILFVSLILLTSFISASDIAYVMKNKPNQGFLDVFDELGLSVDLIKSKEISSTDFSGYNFVFIGEGKLKNIDEIPVEEMPSVITNKRYGKEFGLLDKGKISKLAANSPLKVENGEDVEVYEKSRFKKIAIGIPYLYLPEKFKNENMQTVVTTSTRYKRELGDVISYSTSGPEKCFFGITKTKYWTPEAKGLFKECVMFALGSGGARSHDIAIVEDYTNSVNGIRIKDDETKEYLLDEIPQLECEKKYVISYKTINNGDYSEDIEFTGTFGEYIWTASKSDLASGSYTTSGSKTITIEEEPGIYTIDILAEIQDYDINPLDNSRSRNVEVVCGDSTSEPLEARWYCAEDQTTNLDCYSLSGGTGTRCYLDEAQTTWDSCSSGWVEI
jgi:hypothetical protein